MQDFIGKILRIYFNNNVQGWVSLTGYYIRKEDDFFIVKDVVSNKIKYINKRYIESIEIIGDIENDK